jgi:hypothetical protein
MTTDRATSRQTKIIPLPREMQERWQQARSALSEAIGATGLLPLPPFFGHYIPKADDFLSQQLKRAPAKNATAAFVVSPEGRIGVELCWWTDGN